MIFLIMLIRWTIPRIRYDQVMMMAWQGMIPAALASVVVTSVMVYKGWTSLPALLAANAAIPVINALSDMHHPCQALSNSSA